MPGHHAILGVGKPIIPGAGQLVPVSGAGQQLIPGAGKPVLGSVS